MPRDITTTVYEYHELSPEAQAKARDWFREVSAGDTFFAEPVIEEAASIAARVGIEIKRDKDRKPVIQWSGFSSQGDGASFEGTYKYEPGSWQAIRAEYPGDSQLIACAMDLDRAGSYFPRLCEGRSLRLNITTTGRYSHSHGMEFEFSEYGYTVTETLKAALRRFADYIYSQLQAAYEWDTSDECVAETIEANAYTFTADGKRYG